MSTRWLRLRRFLWRTLGIISVLIILAIAPLYVRSYFVADFVGRFRDQTRAVTETVPVWFDHQYGWLGTHSHRGLLSFYWNRTYEHDRGMDTFASPLKVVWYFEKSAPEASATGWAGFSGQYKNGPLPGGPWWTRWGQSVSISIPHWFFFLLAAAGVALSEWRLRRLRHKQRQHLGLCIHCAYDLRASQHRCPECGRPFAPPPQPPR